MRRFFRLGTFLLVLSLALSSASAALAQTPAASSGATAHGIRIADMDLSVAPEDHFWRYANGGWLDRTEIPADRGRFGVVDQLALKTIDQQLAQLDALIRSNTLTEGSDRWKALRFFEQGMDIETREAQGIDPLRPRLDLIASITDLLHLHEAMASTAFSGMPDFFDISVTPDPADSTTNTLWLAGPSLGLPDETYYIDDSESTIEVREAYKHTAAQFFQRTGMSGDDAMTAAQAVLDFETVMASHMVTKREAQDFSTVHNPTTLDEMQTLYPALDWQTYLTALGATVDGSSILIDAQPRLLQSLPDILAATDFQTIQNYLVLQLMLGAAPYLDREMQDIAFGLQQALTGAQEQEPLEQRVLGAANELMPEALGQLYVAEYFPPEAKAEVEQLTANMISAFRIRIQNNAWMSPETKAAAIEKLDAMKVKVGYPDKWKSYEHYVVGDSYWTTRLESSLAESRRQMGAYGQPVDRSEWWMSPQTVDAGYSPWMNDIMFPAAFLQAPFFDPEADLASTYGGIGYAIGHEITHGFDFSGSHSIRMATTPIGGRKPTGRPRRAESASRRPIFADRGVTRSLHRRPADRHGKRRRHGRPANRLRRLATCPAKGRRSRRDRRTHPESAILHRRSAKLAGESPPGDTAYAGAIQRPRAHLRPRQRPGPKHGCLLRRIRYPARRPNVFPA